MSDNAIETEALSRSFGSVVAVDSLDLQVPAGTMFGFLGPNGAGKTTTLKMLTGLLLPSSGRARIAGFDILDEALDVKRRIGVVPERLGLYDRLSLAENLTLVGRLHGLDDATIRRRSSRLLEHLDLSRRKQTLALDASTGMRKKTALAAALLPNPEVLFLDEPFEGVDAVSSRVIKDILKALVTQRGVTVFFSTHILELVEKLCDQAAIIQQGRLVAQGSLDELRGRSASDPEAGGSLEEVFLRLVDAQPSAADRLDWLQA